MRAHRIAAGLAGLIFLSTVFGVSAAFAVDPTGGVGFQVQVTASANPTVPTAPAVPVGQSVANATFPIRITGLDPFAYVEIYVNSTPVLVASGFADAAGVFATTVSLPPNLEPGEHSITATLKDASGNPTTLVLVQFAVTSSGKIARSGASTTTSPTRSSGSGSTQGVSSETLTGAEADAALGPDPFALGGQLYFGGAKAAADYRDGVFSPKLVSSIVVRNVSTQSVSPRAELSITNALGAEIRRVNNLDIADLQPGETRRITFTSSNVGSWGVYNVGVHVTLPGTDTPGVTRDASAFIVPLTSLLVAAAIALLALLITILWNRFDVELPWRRREAASLEWDAIGADA